MCCENGNMNSENKSNVFNKHESQKIKCKQTNKKDRKRSLIQIQFFEVKSLWVNYRMEKKEKQKGWRETLRE